MKEVTNEPMNDAAANDSQRGEGSTGDRTETDAPSTDAPRTDGPSGVDAVLAEAGLATVDGKPFADWKWWEVGP